MDTKSCNKCKEVKDLSEFHKSKYVKTGYAGTCKQCTNLRYKEKKQDPILQISGAIRSTILVENKILKWEDKRLCSVCKTPHPINNMVQSYCKPCFSQKQKEYRNQEDTKGKLKVWKSTYYKNNIEDIKEKNKKYREENKDKYREYSNKYAANNKDKARKYREDNKEKLSESRKIWTALNKDRLKAYKAEYYQKKKLAKLEDSKC